MNVSIKYIKADKILLYGFLFAIFLLLCTVIFILTFYRHLPPFLPLFNQLSWGDIRLGTKNQLYIPVCIGVLILIGNSILTSVFYEKMPLVSRILCITAVLAALFIFIFTVRTIQLVL